MSDERKLTKEDRQKMAVEVDQYLSELVKIANQKSGDGAALFSGSRFFDDAFLTLDGNVEGANNSVITQVMYKGNIETNRVEIAENKELEVGDDVMLLLVAGDIRENVIAVLSDTLNQIKSTVTQKTEYYI